MDGPFSLVFKEGALRWAHNDAPFSMPRNVTAKVGEHQKGFNKTIGKTLDGRKKRFWLGSDQTEAEKKAAHIANVWELIKQRDGEQAAWDDETLALLARSVHIDKLLKISRDLEAATSSISSDSASLQLVQASGPVVPVVARQQEQQKRSVTLYDALDAYKASVEQSTGSPDYLRRKIELADDLKRYRDNCDLAAIDFQWLESLTNFIKKRPKHKRTGMPIKPGTVGTCLQHWRQFFDWVDSASESETFGGWEAPRKWEKLFKKKNIELTKREKDRAADGPEQITIGEIKALLGATTDDRQKMILLTGLFAGQGQKELSVTRRDEFDLKTGTLSHRRNKTGQKGTYWLPKELVTLLKEYFAKTEAIGDNLAFSTREGQPLVTESSDSVRQMYEDIWQRAQPHVRECITFYSLRRYFGHRARVMGGTDLQKAALAHAADTVGEVHYSNHRDFRSVADVGKAIYRDLVKAKVFSKTAQSYVQRKRRSP